MNIDPATTKIIAIIFAVAFAIVGVLGFSFYLYELYLGAVSPVAFFAFVAFLLYGVQQIAQSYFNRIHAASDAAKTQAVIVSSAVDTQNKVIDVQTTLHNGLKHDIAQATAAQVKIDSAEVASELKATDLQNNTRATISNTAQMVDDAKKKGMG